MNDRRKLTTSLATVALLGLAVASDANADSDQYQRGTGKQIEACVSEIARHADYDDASRVIHLVTALEQRNLVEMEVRVETSVYLADDAAQSRAYSISCVADTMGGLVEFRFNAKA